MDPLCGAPDDARWLAFCRAFTPWALARGARTSLTQARPVDAQALREGAAAPALPGCVRGWGSGHLHGQPSPRLATELLARALDAPPCCRRAVITRSAHAALHSVGHYVGYEAWVRAAQAGSSTARPAWPRACTHASPSPGARADQGARARAVPPGQPVRARALHDAVLCAVPDGHEGGRGGGGYRRPGRRSGSGARGRSLRQPLRLPHAPLRRQVPGWQEEC